MKTRGIRSEMVDQITGQGQRGKGYGILAAVAYLGRASIVWIIVWSNGRIVGQRRY